MADIFKKLEETMIRGDYAKAFPLMQKIGDRGEVHTYTSSKLDTPIVCGPRSFGPAPDYIEVVSYK